MVVPTYDPNTLEAGVKNCDFVTSLTVIRMKGLRGKGENSKYYLEQQLKYKKPPRNMEPSKTLQGDLEGQR